MCLNHGGFAGAVSTSDKVNAWPRLQHKTGVTHEVFKLDLGDKSQGKSRARGFSVARQCPRELCGGAAIIVTRLPAFKRIHDGLQNRYYVRIFEVSNTAAIYITKISSQLAFPILSPRILW